MSYTYGLIIIKLEIPQSKNLYYCRHLFLGQMLLLGLLLGSCVGFAYAVEPNEFSCAAIRLGTGLAYGLIYTSLLVKQNFLISLNNGVYLPASYQVNQFPVTACAAGMQ